MKRYSMEQVTRCGEPWEELNENLEGEWVRYEDFQRFLKNGKKLLRWALIEWAESEGRDLNCEPDHQCNFDVRPDLGKCELHDNYWNAMEESGLLSEMENEWET